MHGARSANVAAIANVAAVVGRPAPRRGLTRRTPIELTATAVVANRRLPIACLWAFMGARTPRLRVVLEPFVVHGLVLLRPHYVLLLVPLRL